MIRSRCNRSVLFVLAFCISGTHALANCELFYDSLNDLESISSNGGAVFGPISFVSGVNDDAAVFGGSTLVIYPDDMFDAMIGSVSLWFKKNSSDSDGGIWQIGTLGQPNSIGLFYTEQTNLHFEIRNDNGDIIAIHASDTLSQTEWVHIIAMWSDQGDVTDIFLRINGEDAGGTSLPGAFVHNAGQLRLGTTGFYGYAEGLVDELRFFDWVLHDGEGYAEYVYSSNRHNYHPTEKSQSTGPVQVVGKTLQVNGRPFRVKGVGYAPTPIGSWPGSAFSSDPDILARDMPLLRGMNVNTIRTWAEIPDETLLDACTNGGVDPIYVILGFWVPSDGGIDYSDPTTIADLESDFADYVNQFKDHPAVLGWGIGNENNISYEGDVADWFALADGLAEVAYTLEGASYHPTIVVNGDMRFLGDVDYGSDDVSMSNVDIWGHNVYFGSDAHCYFDYYDRLSAKPMIATEYGIDAWDNQSGAEYQSVQAQYVVQQWRQIKANCAGATVMAYSDEWWKADNPSSHDLGGYMTRMHPDEYSNEEWWGMLWAEDNGNDPDILHPRQAYDDLAAEYADVNGDYDLDDDVDLADFAAFQRCFGSSAGGACGNAFEFVIDGVIDLEDFAWFHDCFSGADQPPACAS